MGKDKNIIPSPADVSAILVIAFLAKRCDSMYNL